MKSKLILITLVILMLPLAVATEITGDLSTDPDFYQECVESWTCTEWSACSGGTQTRTCTDANACGTTLDKPAESQSCTEPAPSEDDDSDEGSSGGSSRRKLPTTITIPKETSAQEDEEAITFVTPTKNMDIASETTASNSLTSSVIGVLKNKITYWAASGVGAIILSLICLRIYLRKRRK